MDFEEEKAKKGETPTQQFWNHIELFFEPITPKILERLNPKVTGETLRHCNQILISLSSGTKRERSIFPDPSSGPTLQGILDHRRLLFFWQRTIFKIARRSEPHVWRYQPGRNLTWRIAQEDVRRANNIDE